MCIIIFLLSSALTSCFSRAYIVILPSFPFLLHLLFQKIESLSKLLRHLLSVDVVVVVSSIPILPESGMAAKAANDVGWCRSNKQGVCIC